MKGTGEGKIKKNVFTFSRISALLFFVLIITGVFIVSCTKVNEFSIGSNFVEAKTKLSVIDTFKVDLSTVLFDSLITSQTKVAFVGHYNDNEFGSVESETYFDLAYQSFEDIPDNAVYDSAAFVLAYSGEYYGDTTSLMTINVHQLTELIEPFKDGYLYNNSSFDYSPEAIGSVSFYPGPKSTPDTTVSILVNAFGENIYNMIVAKDPNIKSEDWFKDYFKGFVLTSGSVDNKAILDFKATESSLFLKIYYHLDGITPEDKVISITMGSSGNQFNHIKQDLSATALVNINNEKYKELSSSETDGKIYMQGLTGLSPKFRFPSAQNILMNNRYKILKAELVIEPERNSYNEIFPLPKKVYAYETDKLNRITGTIKDDDGNSLAGTLAYDKEYNENTSYTFNITDYINDELSDAMFDYNHGLLINLDQEKARSDLGRMIIADENHSVKLRLYYLSY